MFVTVQMTKEVDGPCSKTLRLRSGYYVSVYLSAINFDNIPAMSETRIVSVVPSKSVTWIV